MSRYLEQTQSTAIAKLLSRVGFSPSALAMVSSSSPPRSPNFVTTIAVKNQLLAVHQQALTALLASRSDRDISRRIGVRRRKTETKPSVRPLVSNKTTLLTLKLPEELSRCPQASVNECNGDITPRTRRGLKGSEAREQLRF